VIGRRTEGWVRSLLLVLILSGIPMALLLLRSRRRARPGWVPTGPLRSTAILVKNPEARTSVSKGDLVLMFPQQREGLALNPVAARCWELIDGACSLHLTAEMIAREYDVVLRTAEDEVLRFAARLREGFYALEESEWRLAHTHFNEIFAGTTDEGITEIRSGDSMVIHVATGALGPGGTLATPRRPWPWESRRRASRNAFARHEEREASRREAMAAFDTAWDHSAAGRLDAALAGFLDAARLVPGWANPHYQLGYVHLRAGRHEMAVEEFTLAERLSPGYFMVREYLHLARKLAAGSIRFESFLLFERAASTESRDPDTVIALCRRAVEISPEFAPAYLLIGRACARKRDYESALWALRSAIVSDPDKATLCNALFARASVFQATGLASEAARELEKVIELDGSTKATRSAMERLASSDSAH